MDGLSPMFEDAFVYINRRDAFLGLFCSPAPLAMKEILVNAPSVGQSLFVAMPVRQRNDRAVSDASLEYSTNIADDNRVSHALSILKASLTQPKHIRSCRPAIVG